MPDPKKVQQSESYGLFFPSIGATIWVYPQAARALPSERGIGPMAVAWVLCYARGQEIAA